MALRPAALACCLLLASAASAATRGDVTVRGNIALQSEVYLAVLTIPEETPPSAALAEVLAAQAERFLHDSGYELGRVRGALVGGRMVLEVREGLLEKIVFRGRLTFNMLRLRLALDLPRDVFNRPSLERQLDALSTRLRIDRPTFALVPTQHRQHEGPQVDDAATAELLIQGRALVMPQQDYELHLHFPEREWSTGPGLDVRSGYFDGLELGVNYQGRGLLVPGDRWRVGLMGGAGLRQDIAHNVFYAFPSRAFAEAQWYTPQFASVARAFVWLRGEGLARQRRDLLLENYVSVAPELSANVQVRPFESLTIYTGFGFQYFRLLGERGPETGELPRVQPSEPRWRGFTQLGLDVTLDEADGRYDRRHGGHLEVRLWSVLNRPEQPTLLELRARWQKVFAFGWHDLWLKGRGSVLYGDVLYPFEEPLGDYLRGVFGDIFVRTAAGLRGEFRFSLTRDLYKLGLFVDVAGYGELDRETLAQTPRFGAAFGPGFHALVEGMFQLDLNLSFGLTSTGRFATGVNAVLLKVF